MLFQKVKGTTDFFPEDKEVQRAIFNKLRTVAENYNFKEIETPAFEYLDLLTKKEGEDIKSQIFVLEQRGKEELGLRFDLTVPAARMFIEKQKGLSKPVKWYYIDKMWRYEQPQKGRAREFYQFGVELFGSDKPESDAECINILIDGLCSFGLTQNDFSVKINNRILMHGLFDFLPAEKFEELLGLIDKKRKLPPETFDYELDKMFSDAKINEKIKNILSLRAIKDIEKLNLSKEAEEGLNRLKQVLDYVDNNFVEVDLSSVRGLAYYTGMVYEAYDKAGKFRAIAGGGRYDNMIGLFGGEQCAATGFAIGYSTLSLLLEEKMLIPKTDSRPDYFVAYATPELYSNAVELCRKLRKSCKVDIDLCGRKLGKQFEYANSIGAKKVIILGPEELAKNEAKVKDMASGEEKRVKISSLLQ